MLGQRYVLVLVGNVPGRLHGLGESYCRNVSDSELGLNAAIRPIPATFRMRLLPVCDYSLGNANTKSASRPTTTKQSNRWLAVRHHICSDPSAPPKAGTPSRASAAIHRGDSGVAGILCERSVPGVNRPSSDVPNSAGREAWGAHRGFPQTSDFLRTATHRHPRQLAYLGHPSSSRS